ncbi:MAG TPA: glycosyltransferase family A protein [Pyrinomonadaceae bacterium]
MPKSVSVVIPTYNYGRFIEQAIRSVLDQTCSPSEIIVVDDGSTDETMTVVGRFGARVRYIRQNNAGVCAARNRGVAESTSELIAFLDADDTWEPTNLEKHLARFESDDEPGMVHSGLREFDDETGETIQLHIDGGEDGVAESLLLWEGPVIVRPGGSVTVSRKAFNHVGGFDTRIVVGEDWDFCYRVARSFKVGFVAEPLVNYRNHTAGAHHNVQNMERGMLLFYEKAFATDDREILKLRRRAYGDFHKVMSGSYFHSRQLGKFLSHAASSIWMRPANLGYFLQFPLRKFVSSRSR